ncbi:MAG: trigger factor [Candidatus Omnitrophica bacterium]|nr:trigger factor [Candidatus Omnitrophota bacterium]
MKTAVKKLDDTRRELTIHLEGDTVKNKFEEVFERITKEAKVPGFRPGHAPRDIVEKNFSSRANQMVLEELIPDIYHEAVKKEGWEVLESPEISDVALERSTLSFKAVVEIAPEVDVKNYKGIKVEYKKIEVKPDEVQRSIDALKESRKLSAADDALAKSLGYPTLEELKQVIANQLFAQKSQQQHKNIEAHLVDTLVDALDFKLPQSLVARQSEELLRQAKLDLALQGVSREKIQEQENTMREKLQPQAKKQVKVYLVLAAIAKKENIPLEDQMSQQVLELLLKEADWHAS